MRIRAPGSISDFVNPFYIDTTLQPNYFYTMQIDLQYVNEIVDYIKNKNT